VTLVACADVGSTFTKVMVVDLDGAELVAAASHRTTTDTDVLDGLSAAVAATGRVPAVIEVCSSAGGGLRLAVVGYEALVSAEAARRVALSAGARVVHVAAGRLDRAAVSALRAARPDVVLLVGGTDGGDADVLLHNAGRLGAARWRRPVVLAGNAVAAPQAAAVLTAAGVLVSVCANVLPGIGELSPGPARAAIRDVFLRHVIGGKGLSRGPRFARMVRAATPDAVRTAVERLAGVGERQPDGPATDVLVVDVGGATTDVYSVVAQPPRCAEVAGSARVARTVEGDLGVRWGAVGVVEAAAAERLPAGPELAAAARQRVTTPGLAADAGVDLELARLAATVALRRHARGEPVGGPGSPRRGGRDLERVRIVVGSGGVFRHTPAADAVAVVRRATADAGGGWAVPVAPLVLLDTACVLAPAGLLAAQYPTIADALLRRYLHAA
jgi:uncharacterized protein (TIGR01319 family)